MKDLILIAKKADLFGKSYSFEEFENQKFTTTVGNISTLLVVIVCIVIGFLFGQEVYKRETPIVIVSEDSLEYSKVNFKEYPILISVSRSDGSQVLNSTKLFTFQIVKLTIDVNLKSSFEVYSGLETCNPDNYDEKFRSHVKKTLEDNEKAGKGKLDIFCPNSSLFVQNAYTSINSTFIGINFFKCNPDVKECLPNLDKVAKDVYVNMLTYNFYNDPKNYSHPIKIEHTVITQQLSDLLSKRLYYNIVREKLVTNIGWLLENIVEEEYLTLKDSSKDVNPYVDSKMYSITISSPTKRKITYRKYMKIQDLLASIGGFFNILFLTVFIILKHYVDYSYYTSLVLSYNKKAKNIHTNIILKNLGLKNEIKEDMLNYQKIDLDNREKIQLFSLLQGNKILDNPKMKNAPEKVNLNDDPNSKTLNNFILKNIKESSLDKLKNESSLELKDNAKICDVNKSINSNEKSNYFDKINYVDYLWNDLLCKKSNSKILINISRSLMSFHDIIELNLKEHYRLNDM